MSHRFRELLKKIGSGQHTHQDLTRGEARLAAELMLTGEATPAQIGAFLIAHRIKRPTGEELAGFLDAYGDFMAPIQPIAGLKSPVVFGVPYDGRTRTAPLIPFVALALTAAGQPVILHGADSLPTKYGLGLTAIWQDLGLNFRSWTLDQVGELLQETGFTFYYTPRHFPQSVPLNEYRDQIGKRPPLATLELMANPYGGLARLAVGYVHPPTEQMIRSALGLRGISTFTLIKGLEGSPDLKLSQTTILALADGTYLKLNAQQFNFPPGTPRSGSLRDRPLDSREAYRDFLRIHWEDPQQPLPPEWHWNGAVYLWHYGLAPTLESALHQVEDLWRSGKIKAQWQGINTGFERLDRG